jgi:hypothetical protein
MGPLDIIVAWCEMTPTQTKTTPQTIGFGFGDLEKSINHAYQKITMPYTDWLPEFLLKRFL